MSGEHAADANAASAAPPAQARRRVGQARSVAVVGLEAVAVTVEAHVSQGLPGMTVIGASGAAGREAASRVRTALGTVGSAGPSRKVLLSLAPAEVPTAGARFDLAMALAVLQADGVVGEDALQSVALLGELALDGQLRAVPGVLPAAAALPGHGVRRLLLPDANAVEAALVTGLEVVPVADLAEALAVLAGGQHPRRPPEPAPAPATCRPPDLADVRGQAEARRALEVAAVGGHHLLLLGTPGCGKSMLARRLPGVLPPLARAAALELAAIRSVAGLLTGGDGAPLDRLAPLRAPHHTVSAAAMLGGGSHVARPGEVSLAHHGVLFCDELFEWPRSVLDALREPLEDGVVRVARSKATVCYPARFQLVCAANPCPCGGGVSCGCADEAVWAYRAKLSGPLADRLDLAPTVAPLVARDLLDTGPGEPTAAVAARVAAARARAEARWRAQGLGPDPRANAEVDAGVLGVHTRAHALRRLAGAVETGELTGRGYVRTLRVARSIADLEGSAMIEQQHVAEARAHRLALRRDAHAGWRRPAGQPGVG